MGVRFRSDTRGVTEVVGAVLLLGILMLTLSIYQVSVVPNQNAATEFDHNQEVEDELVDVRNAILEARSTGKDAFASVTLGTRYQDRTLTVNPPSPSGTIQTVKQLNISVNETGGDGRNDPLKLSERPLDNRFIEYTPQYYAYDRAGTMRYENTVVYHEYEESTVFLTDQTLLRGNTVTLIPLEGRFRKDGTKRVAVEPKPGVLETVKVTDPNVTVPTELPQDDWQQLLEDELGPDDTMSVSDGNLTLSLNGTYDIAYAPIGVNRVPNEGDRGSDGTEINPAAPGDVSLENVVFGTETRITFNNTADTTNFTDIRINFYESGNDNVNDPDIYNETGTESLGTLVIGGDYLKLEPPIRIEGGTTTDIRLQFNTNTRPKQKHWFVVTIVFESGETGLYFVSDQN